MPDVPDIPGGSIWHVVAYVIATAAAVVIAVWRIGHRVGSAETNISARIGAVEVAVDELKECGKEEHAEFYRRLNKHDSRLDVLDERVSQTQSGLRATNREVQAHAQRIASLVQKGT